MTTIPPLTLNPSPIQRQSSTTSADLTAVDPPTKKLPSSKFKGVVPQPNGRWGAQIYDKHHRVWLGTFPTETDAARAYDVAVQRFRGRDSVTDLFDRAELSFLLSRSKPELVDMLRKHTYDDELAQSRRLGPHATSAPVGFSDPARELLFDKVVTPSDVGKLNRLVIPKQQAERHFRCKGVLMNFEDSSGRVWRFRYSYWNSSQSYVLTKGWSRFVRDKGLKAGDVVSFSRSVATDVAQLYIDACDRGRAESEEAVDRTVVRLFGVDISESGRRKRGREVDEAFSHAILFKKPLVALAL